MKNRRNNPFIRVLTIILLLGALLGILPTPQPRVLAQTAHVPLAATKLHTLYVPIATRNSPWKSPFGVQAEAPLTLGSPVLSRTVELGSGWARMGPISWRRVQPIEGGPINWSALAPLENELRTVQQYGITPEIVVFDSPSWATINQPIVTSCGAIRPSKFGAFATFMREIIQRYSKPEFNVHHWELGNEIDVDPRLVPPNSGFGCWGNINDPFYGGRLYGEMLKVVAPVMRTADPSVQIWIGGLLLDLPNTTEPGKGKPELFLQGILEAGAAPYFDLVPYHAYMPYVNQTVDPDQVPGAPWTSLGGRVLGKARFLRQIMAKYGVNKPLFMNETALMCPDYFPFSQWCSPPSQAFYDMQAVYAVRTLTRTLSAGVRGALWYTINGPGWRYTGLLDAQNNPHEAYLSLQALNKQLETAEYVGKLSYGNGIEAYEFGRFDRRVQVVWAVDDQNLAISVPQAQFISMTDRKGNPLTPITDGSNYVILVRFDPIYITLQPTP